MNGWRQAAFWAALSGKSIDFVLRSLARRAGFLSMSSARPVVTLGTSSL